MYLLLNGDDWKVKGFWPYVPLMGKSMELGQDLLGITDWIDAVVPGGVHMDLLRSGMIEDPFIGLNSLKCEWVESKWWQYKKTFKIGDQHKSRNIRLIFKGIDYKAHIYLNNTKLGTHEGMYTRFVYDVSSILDFENENILVVLFEDAPDEMGQIGYTSLTKTQKARFNYKWDFSTRMVNIGIWDDVILDVTGDVYIEDFFVRSDVCNGKYTIKADIDVRHNPGIACYTQMDVYDGDVLIAENICIEKKTEGGSCFYGEAHIERPKLWCPNGSGSQNLYRVCIQVLDDKGCISDSREIKTGLRTVEYVRNEGASDEALPYTIVINGRKVYIKGVNLTPFDLMYGNTTPEQYEDYILLIKNMNVNLVRVWGGGIIEKECFYNLCDKYGIMVWQEFIQSSSGIDNIPSKIPEFISLLGKTAVQAVKEKRNHVCHTLWGGGNELMDENGVPVTYEDENISKLKAIVDSYDPGKMFLPTSASGPREFLSIEPEHKGQNHDVHGPWKFSGVVDHYKIFNESDSMLHGEFGIDGCSSFSSLKRFLEDKDLIVTNMRDSMVWRYHGEWWDTYERDTGIFGIIDDLEIFTEASQWTQAEALRYAVEANRRRKYQNSGSIIWQFNEPFPNVSCTCLVDYFKNPKMAYYFVGNAYAQRSISMKYDKLFFNKAESFNGQVYMVNSIDDFICEWRIEVISINGVKLMEHCGKSFIRANACSKLHELEFNINSQWPDIFLVRLSFREEAKEELWKSNVYIFGREDRDRFKGLPVREHPIVEWELVSTERRESFVKLEYKVGNKTGKVALYTHITSSEVLPMIFCAQNYSTILPGEESLYEVIVKPEDIDFVKGLISFKCW